MTKSIKKSQNKPKLSIIVLSFNTAQVLDDCLTSLKSVRNELPFEVIVSDNGSTDQTLKMIEKKHTWIRLLKNQTNLGFAKGNNAARGMVKGDTVLFLNSDTIVPKNTLQKTYQYLHSEKEIGAVTCKTVLPDGSLDRDARRSFPTPWVAFTHFSGLDRVFSGSRIFSKYWYGYRSSEVIQEVDVIQGAYLMSKKTVLDKVDWFDEDYFLDGEDIDLCWKIKSAGYKIIYIPDVSILHIKKASKKVVKNNKNVVAGVRAMEVFYKKRMWSKYPLIINYLVVIGIKAIKTVRIMKLKLA